MNKLVSPKITALAFGVLVVCFAVGFYVFAWQEPTEAPPEGNVPTPLNIGPTHQTKEGDLTIGIAEIHGDGSMGPELNADKLDDYHAADLMAQTTGGKPLYTTKCSWHCEVRSAPIYEQQSSCTSTCTPPNCADGDASLVTGCAATGISSAYYNGYVWVYGYGYCERVCRDE